MMHRGVFQRGSRLFVLAVASMIATAALAEVNVAGRHLIILRESVDAVWGSYMFAVQNADSAPARFAGRLRLPRETVDFMPQEGIAPEQLKLDGDALAFEKEFPPGTTIVTVGFKVPAGFGKSVLTLAPATAIESLTVLVPKAGSVRLDAGWLAIAPEDAAPDPDYRAFMATGALALDEERVLTLSGVPEGRKRLWILGGVVAALMLALAAAATLRTRPRLAGHDGATVLIG